LTFTKRLSCRKKEQRKNQRVKKIMLDV